MARSPGALLAAVALMAPLCGMPADALGAESYLPIIGGSGGSQFLSPCPIRQHLTGFELRAGDDIDAIHALCVTVYSTGSVTGPQLTEGSGLVRHYRDATREVYGAPYDETFGDWSTLPVGWHGGAGGGRQSVVCPRSRPVVVAMRVAAEGVDTVSINNIHLYCGLALPSQQLDDNPSAIFDAPQARDTAAVLGFGGSTVGRTAGFQRCPEGTVGVGIHGRSGEYVDAIGLICDAPRVAKALALGRVDTTDDATPDMSLCDRAKSARARNSPAAPSLEKQCAEMTPKTGLALGRVQTVGPPPPICEAARSARARNSPAAPGLARQCIAAGGSMDPPPP